MTRQIIVQQKKRQETMEQGGSCPCQYLDDRGELWTCNEQVEDPSNFFSVCGRCKKHPWSLHAYAKGLLREWAKHMKLFGVFDDKRAMTIYGEDESTNAWDVLSSRPKVHAVYAFRKEERYMLLRGSTQVTPFVQFSYEDLCNFWRSRMWVRNNEALRPGYVYNYPRECEQFTRCLCSTSAADYRKVDAFTYLRNKKKTKARLVLKKYFQVFWEKSEWEQGEWKEHALFSNGDMTFHKDERSTGEDTTLDHTKEQVVEEDTGLSDAIRKISKAFEQGGDTASMLRQKFMPYFKTEPTAKTDSAAQTEETAQITTAAQTEETAQITTAAQTDSAAKITSAAQTDSAAQITPTAKIASTAQTDFAAQTGTFMRGMYWYVKQKNTNTLVGKTYPGNRTVPNLANTFDEEFAGRNIVIVDVLGNTRSYTLHDLIGVQRELDKCVHQRFQDKATKESTPPGPPETTQEQKPKSHARPRKRRRGIHQPRFGTCSMPGCKRSVPSASMDFCSSCSTLKRVENNLS